MMPSLLVIDDDAAVRHMFRHVFQDEPVELHVAGSAREGLELVASERPDVAVIDIMLPDASGLSLMAQIQELDAKIPVVFITAGGASDTAIEAMKLGAFDYLLKPLDVARIREVVERALAIRRSMHAQVKSVEADAGTPPADGALVGRSAAMQKVYKEIGRVAPQNVTVLIQGESGTGKELVARAIHEHSHRAGERYCAVNCAAIPDSLLESELFGHEKGAFTGADTKRIGKFELCSGGTLFLDEIGDMTPLVQSKVLRLLQEQRFERVGGNETIETDVRIITASNRDLEEMVGEGTYRGDLYYRLNGFSIKLPPLRERTEDIPLLVEHFMGCFSRELGKEVSDVSSAALDLLVRYRWPGNVRELQSVLKQAILHATGHVLLPEFLPNDLRRTSSRTAAVAAGMAPLSATALEAFVDEQLQSGSEDLYAESLAHMERIVLARILRHTKGNQSRAAKILGITRGSLRNKIRTLHITIDPVVRVDQPAGASWALSSV